MDASEGHGGRVEEVRRRRKRALDMAMQAESQEKMMVMRKKAVSEDSSCQVQHVSRVARAGDRSTRVCMYVRPTTRVPYDFRVKGNVGIF